MTRKVGVFAAGVVRPDGSVTFSTGFELTAKGRAELERDRLERDRFQAGLEGELKRLRVFRASELGRALEGKGEP